MSVPVQVTYRGVHHLPDLEELANAKLEKIHAISHHITHCHLTLEVPHRHQHSGQSWEVHIELAIPGHTFVVKRESTLKRTPDSIKNLVREAFKATQREVSDYQERRRKQQRHQDEPAIELG